MQDYADFALRVRYAETDQMGVVYYANHFVWFELGRTEFFRQRGVVYKDMEKDGYYLVVAEANCRYKSPARYDELLTVRTRVKQASSRALVFSYEVHADADRRLIATGESTHIFTDRQGKPHALPERYRDAILHAAAAAKK